MIAGIQRETPTQTRKRPFAQLPTGFGASFTITDASGLFRYAEHTVAAGVFGLFIVYYSLAAYKIVWAGDIHLYVAAVQSLYADFTNPVHETLPISGRYSNFFSPYLLVVAWLGKRAGLTPYGALQVAGIFNMAFYGAALLWFFRSVSIVRHSALPAVMFLLVSAFLHNEYYHWSSEMNFFTMNYVQSYPSMLAWGLALMAFGFAARFLTGGPSWMAPVVGALMWMIVLTHSLTASWAVGIVGVQGLLSLVQRSRARPRVLALYAAVAVGVLCTQLWPYVELRGVSSAAWVTEPAPFADKPFAGRLWLYWIAIPAALWLVRLRQHAFLGAAFAATFAVYLLTRWVGIDYGSRYVFFQAFFVQVAVAEVAALALLLAVRHPVSLAFVVSPGTHGRLLALVFVGVVVGAAVESPTVKAWGSRGLLKSPLQLIRMSSAHDAYYSWCDELRGLLRPGDVVMAPLRFENERVAAVTGARVVIAPAAARVPDYEDRLRDVERFFAESTRDERQVILDKHAVRWILLTELDLHLVETIEADYGPPVQKTSELALFAPARRPVASGPSVLEP